MDAFGPLIRRLRQRAGLGLRTFAELVDERASSVSAIEQGHRRGWQRQEKLKRAADILGLVENSDFCRRFYDSARGECPPALIEATHGFNGVCENGDDGANQPLQPVGGSLAWWWTSESAAPLDEQDVAELAEFVGAECLFAGSTPQTGEATCLEMPSLTELAIEWRVKQLLGPRRSQVMVAPVDVEATLEREAGVQLRIIPGLIPRFSVQACAVWQRARLTFYLDRIVADSRPLAAYRELLANCFAPAVLWPTANGELRAAQFHRLASGEQFSQLQRDAGRFALSMLLPAGPVLTAAESAYREVVEQQGWVEVEVGTRAVRNRLAEQFAVPPLLVHMRLLRWPCHVYGRIAQALAAQETTLPPVDWFEECDPPQQRTLFEKNVV